MRHTLLTAFAAFVIFLPAVSGAVADDLDKLIKDTSSKDKKVSLRAIDALGKAGDAAKPAVPALIKALSREEGELRWHAARSLGFVGPDAAAAIPALLKALGDDSPDVRAYSAFALGEIGDKSSEVVDRLIKTAFDKSVLVRRASLKALLKLDPPQEKAIPVVLKILEEGDPAIITPAMYTLAEEGEGVVPRLCNVLDNEKACYWACLVLAEIGPKAKAAVPHIKGVLKHKDPEVRLQALMTLGEIGPASKPLTPDIVAMLENDKFGGVRYAAAFALGKIGADADATKALNKAVTSKDPFLRMLGAWALARNNPGDKAMVKRAVDLILQSFKSDDVHLRRAAAKAAVDFDVPLDDVAPMLVEALQDKDPVVVGNAIAALAERGPKALKHVDKLLKHKELRYYALLLIPRLGPEAAPAVPALVDVLDEKPQGEADLEFQREVRFALAAIGPGAKGAVPALAKSLDSKNDEICASASYALGKIGPAAKAAVPKLRNNLKSGSSIVQLASMGALLEILPRNPQLERVAVPLLTKGLENEYELVRAECATALGKIGGPAKRALPQLKQRLKDESEFVRQAATEAIKKIQK